jgi:multidrug efflux pump subunit AcrB
VLLTVIAVGAGGLALNGFAGGGQEQRKEESPQTDEKPQPTLVVTASYPGASAAVIADTVAAPIEQQVNGVANLLHLESRSTDDGKYMLAVRFKPGTNLDQALVMVQNRVALAMPILPVAVQKNGITVKKMAPVRLLVSLTSPDGVDAKLFLRVAPIIVKDELARLAGVGEVVSFGMPTPHITVPGDTLPESGRYVSLNGKRAVVLGIYPIGGSSPEELRQAVAAKTAELGTQLPKGARLAIAFDFTANLGFPDGSKAAEYLLIDDPMPDTASLDRKRETLVRCDKLLHEVAGVQDVLVLNENPFEIFRDQPCILVRLTPAGKRQANRDGLMATIRTRIEKIPDAMVRMRDLARPGSFPRCGYPIDLAVMGPEADKVRDLAQKLGEQLQKSKKVTDLWANRGSTPGLRILARLDLSPMVEVTANPAAEVSLVESRTLCEKLFEQGRTESRLPAEYRLTWLQHIPTGK